MRAVLLCLLLCLPAWCQGLPAPTNLQAKPPAGMDGTTRLELRWDPVPGAIGYEVLQYRGSEWWFDAEDPNRTPLTSSTTITGLSADTPYEFVVRAVGSQGAVSPNSAPIGARTVSRASLANPTPSNPTGPAPPKKPVSDPTAPAPEEPSGLIAVFSENDRVQLSWRKVSGAAGYQVEEEIEGKWVPAQDILGEQSDNKVFLLNHPLPGPYRFRVIAVGTNGKRSEPSWPATAHRNY